MGQDTLEHTNQLWALQVQEQTTGYLARLKLGGIFPRLERDCLNFSLPVLVAVALNPCHLSHQTRRLRSPLIYCIRVCIFLLN